MRAGFTMIELIFVIVIIGILTAIATPKLLATRDDAKVSAEIVNMKQILQNLNAEYTATGKIAEESVVTANGTTQCFILSMGSVGKVTLALNTDLESTCTDGVREAVKVRAIEIGMIEEGSTLNKVHHFGGTQIVH
jgi:prepilin-type N-terminal cleavage/methylation domain-containing protein